MIFENKLGRKVTAWYVIGGDVCFQYLSDMTGKVYKKSGDEFNKRFKPVEEEK